MAADATQQFLEANRQAQVALGAAAGPDAWAGSPFEWLKRIPSSSRRGRAGDVLAAIWLAELGYAVTPKRNAGHDRLVNGRAVEIKLSTLWDQGVYNKSSSCVTRTTSSCCSWV